MGGVTRRSLLASLMALSLLCGGLGVAEATVHVVESGVTYEVLTTQEVTEELDKKVSKEVADLTYAKASDVATNTRDIATNKGNISELNGKLTNLTTVVDGKVDKADTLAGYSIKDAYTKGDVDDKLNKKADAANVYTKTDADANFATSAALNTAKTDLEGEITTAKNELDGKIAANTTKITANEKAIQNLNAKAGNTETTLNNLSGHMTTAENNITDLKDADVRLEGKIDQNANDITGLKDKDGELSGKINDNKNLIDQNKTNITKNAADITNINEKLTTAEGNIQTNTDNINALDKKVGTINNGTYLDGNASVADNLGKLDAGLKQEVTDRKTADDALSGRITANANTIAKVNQELVNTNNHFNTELGKTNAALQATNKRTAGIERTDTGVAADNQTVIEGKVHFDQNGNVSGVKDLQTDTIHATGEITSEGLDAGSGEITTKGKVSAGDISTGTLETTGNATIGGNLDVTGTLNIKDVTAEKIYVSKSEENAHYKSEGSIIGEGGNLSVSNKKFDKRNNITKESQLNVNEEGTVNWATSTDATGNVTEGRSEVTADNIKNSVKKTEGGKTFGYEENITADGKVGTVTDKEGNTSSTRQDSKGVYGYAKDKDGNKSYTKQEGNRIAESVIGQDGKQTKSEMTSTDITNTAKDGTITSDAKDIVNKATGNISNSSATMDTTVTGKATESFGELETEVKGNEKHTVKGDQTNEVDGKQINTIKNGQENIISGGQINNITGDQTTTITGNKKETVTENVTEDYQKDLTTTVGGDETHEVKGTKTETVEGKLTENFKGGQETNVSGTQTINATDINRNASSGMIDTVDNAYGTNKETKVAGSTTTEVSIKGTGESGTYIRGATEARDYIINGTLSNSETKTAEATSTEITDGNGKTSATIQDKTQISGSVTNGTSSAVSNVKADSIDTAVKEGTNTSLISQKKDSITSAVGNGTTSTVIQQGDKDITIASNGGTVGIVGKDIINNATNEITNTAGTKITDKVGNNTRVIDQTSITDTVGTANRKIEDGKITDTAGDSTVTTENGKGTTFAKAGSAAYSTKAGATKDTNIAGNLITTGRVNANELAVSDKDGDNTADFSVEAGEGKGVKASAGNGNTTGSLDVKADGIYGSATDKDGNKTSTKVTATENSFQVQDKDGNIKNHQVNTKDKSENTIKNGDKTNIVTSTADGTTFNNSKANTAFEGGTYTDTTIKGNTITTGKVTMDYADVMKDLGVRGNANITGKTTTGSLEVTGTTTTKTLNVTEDAKVGRDLAVGGNATIAGDVTAKSYKVGDKTYIDANGINANNQKITNVADGSISEGSKDAVNGGQLYNVKNDLEGKVNKVGANAAAMANLHPMEFDPDSKWNIAAAIGNYGSETAAALGAFYRPNDDVMVNLSTAFGTGENMVGGGVSVRLGKGGNKLSREESNALKDQVNDLTARMDALLSVLNPNMSKDFPDVPENHWAYEAVSRLAGNDIVQGYPDGEFHGERTMTRYEMAEIIYNALSRGAEAEKELVEEFKPELQAMAASEKATAERAEG